MAALQSGQAVNVTAIAANAAAIATNAAAIATDAAAIAANSEAITTLGFLGAGYWMVYWMPRRPEQEPQ